MQYAVAWSNDDQPHAFLFWGTLENDMQFLYNYIIKPSFVMTRIGAHAPVNPFKVAYLLTRIEKWVEHNLHTIQLLREDETGKTVYKVLNLHIARY